MIITIDGPTASGKSTLASSLAKQLNFYHLNSGYLYRSLSYILTKFYNYDEAKLRVPEINDIQQIFDSKDFVYKYEDGKVQIYYKNQTLIPHLKTPIIDNYSSIISAIQAVRDNMLEYQRKFAQNHNIVMEGRDCGSVVFPNADIKFFLTAPLAVRAKRWQNDMVKKGQNYSISQAIEIVNERDQRDLTREISPLIVAPGAIVIDGDDLNQEQLLGKVLDIIKEELRRNSSLK